MSAIYNCFTRIGSSVFLSAAVLEDLYHVPDRITGLQGLSVLNPKRKWNFVYINITKDELQHVR